MEIIIEKGCGLDVHKETVAACRRFGQKTTESFS